MNLGEMAEESIELCKERDGWIVTGQEIVFSCNALENTVSPYHKANKVAVVLKGEEERVQIWRWHGTNARPR